MPTVPVYDSRVREQALEGGFQRAPDVGRDLARAGEAMMRVAEVADRIDLRDAQAKAFDAEAKITSEWLKWDGQARQQFRGQNVDGYAPAAEEWWAKAAETYGASLDPRARALASRSLAAKRVQAVNSVGTFVNAEKERFADETYAADVATTIQFGVTSGDVASTAQQIREKAAVLGARKGWTTEQVQAEQLKNLSAMHLAQITKLAEVNAEAAQKYYDANKAEVNFAQQARVEQVLKGEADNQFAMQKAAELAPKPLAEQLAEAAKIADPTRREKTLTQIKNNYALVKEAENQAKSKAEEQAWTYFNQGKPVPEAILSQMDQSVAVPRLREAQRARADRLAAGKTVKTDWNVYIETRERLAAGERVDLRTLTEKIGPVQMEQLIDIQTRVAKPKTAVEVATSEQQLGAYTRQMNLKGKDLGQFQSAAYEAFNAHAQRTGKPPTYDERQKMLDTLTMEVVTHKGVLWDSTDPAYKAPADVRRKALGATQPPQPVRVTTVEQARALPKGTRFIDPQGVERIR